jgi:hypothetical protein
MGYVYIFEAGGFAAHGAYKMHVVVVVMPFLAPAGAQGIAGGTLAVGNAVNDTLTGKYLQGAVNGHPVEMVERSFDIAMAQCAVRMLQKKVENNLSAVRNAQVIAPKNIDYLVFHGL